MSGKKLGLNISLGWPHHGFGGHHGHHGHHGHNSHHVTHIVTQSATPPPVVQIVPPMQPAPIIQSTPVQPPPMYPNFPTAPPNDNNLSGFSWIPTNPQQCSQLEYKGIVSGYEANDRSPIYVGRAWHDGDLLPCKVIPRHNMAYISYNSKEVSVHNFEMYCQSGPRVQWVAAFNGNIPSGAVAAGNTKSGEALYVGRAHYGGSLVPGKVHPSHRCCYISYAGQEINITNYEVMTVVYL